MPIPSLRTAPLAAFAVAIMAAAGCSDSTAPKSVVMSDAERQATLTAFASRGERLDSIGTTRAILEEGALSYAYQALSAGAVVYPVMITTNDSAGGSRTNRYWATVTRYVTNDTASLSFMVLIAWKDSTDIVEATLVGDGEHPLLEWPSVGGSGWDGPHAFAEAYSGTGAWWGSKAGETAVTVDKVGGACVGWDVGQCARMTFTGSLTITESKPVATDSTNTAAGSRTISIPASRIGGITITNPAAPVASPQP